jgi:hypothetical protein
MTTEPNNVITMPIAQPAPAKFTVTAVIDGFTVQVEMSGKASDLRTLLDKLKQLGATPAPQAQPAATGKPSAPLCPHHQKPMKASRKPGSWFCPHRMENGEYCPEKA